MTKADYLAELEQHLRKLPKKDFHEALDYFTEYFEEAGPENEADVIAELGSPEEAAKDIIQNVLEKDDTVAQSKPKRSQQDWITLIILAILASPLLLLGAIIALSVIISVLIFALSLLIFLAAMLGTGYLFALALVMLSFITLFEAIFIFSSSWQALLMGVGSFFAGIGVAILIFLLLLKLSQLYGHYVMAIFKWLLRKWGKRHEK